MDDDFIAKVATDLPSFPEQVIRLWFDHGYGEGWPPKLDKYGAPEPDTAWRKALGDRPLDFWRQTVWTPERRPLGLRTLDGNGDYTIEMMATAYGLGLPFHPSVPIQNSRERIGPFVKAIEATGTLPVPPILLVRPRGLEILDGCHRLAALHHARTAGLKVDAEHDAWIARGPVDLDG